MTQFGLTYILLASHCGLFTSDFHELDCRRIVSSCSCDERFNLKFSYYRRFSLRSFIRTDTVRVGCVRSSSACNVVHKFPGRSELLVVVVGRLNPACFTAGKINTLRDGAVCATRGSSEPIRIYDVTHVLKAALRESSAHRSERG